MQVTAVITLQAEGKIILPGEEVDIADEREAKSLIDRGFAHPVIGAATPPPQASTPSPQASLDDILEAIDQLNPETDFTSKDKPKVEAIEVVLGQKVSADTRDQAWTLYQKGLKAAGAGADNDLPK